jgi:hypothetical protein
MESSKFGAGGRLFIKLSPPKRAQQGYVLSSISNRSSKHNLKRLNQRGESHFIMIRKKGKKVCLGLHSSGGGVDAVSWVRHKVGSDMR